MKGNDEVVQVLQDVLCAELTAINQYFIHARMNENWGYKKLAAYIQKESIEEMRHAQDLIDRILYFDGAPNMQKYLKINVGRSVPEQFTNDLQVEYDAVGASQQGDRARARAGRQRHALAARGDAEGRGRPHRLARGAARHDQGDRRRELPRAADGMREGALAVALASAALLAAPRAGGRSCAAPPSPARRRGSTPTRSTFATCAS